MTAIKKNFSAVYELIVSNKDKVIDDKLIAALTELCNKSADRESTSIFSVDGKQCLAIHCWQYERWMCVVGTDAVPFGKKSSSRTGLDTMCKEASSQWYRVRNDAKKQKEKILLRHLSGEINKKTAESLIAKQNNRLQNLPKNDKLGFATKEECIKHLQKQNFKPAV